MTRSFIARCAVVLFVWVCSSGLQAAEQYADADIEAALNAAYTNDGKKIHAGWEISER